MPVRYEDLTFTKRCIYQSFSKLSFVHDTPSNMGAHVNGLGLDADDTLAVLRLADRYGLDQCEVMHGSDVTSGEAGFDADKEFIVIITPHHATQGAVQKVAAGKGLVRGAEARKVLEASPSAVTWHAIYGRTNAAGAMVWQDDQRLNPNGPVGNVCAVVFYS